MIKTPQQKTLFDPLMTSKEIALIVNLIRKYKDMIKVVVELGTYSGGTTIAMSKAVSPKAKIYTVEPFFVNRDSIRERVVENLKKYPNIELMEMTAMQAAHQFLTPIDFLFIDADHQDHSILEDVTNWLPKLKSGGIFVADDYFNDQFPSVKRRVDEQTQNWEVLGEVDTIKVFRKP